MEGVKQQLIVVFAAPDMEGVRRVVEEAAQDGPWYASPEGQSPMVLSVFADAANLFSLLHQERADYIMTSIGMESEEVFSMGDVSASLFFGDAKTKSQRKSARSNSTSLNYELELKKALQREDYEEASIIRDIILNKKKKADLLKYRSQKSKIS